MFKIKDLLGSTFGALDLYFTKKINCNILMLSLVVYSIRYVFSERNIFLYILSICNFISIKCFDLPLFQCYNYFNIARPPWKFHWYVCVSGYTSHHGSFLNTGDEKVAADNNTAVTQTQPELTPSEQKRQGLWGLSRDCVGEFADNVVRCKCVFKYR